MKITQENLRTFGGLVLNGGLHLLLSSATGGLFPVGSIVGELLKSITGNLISNQIGAIGNIGYDQLAGRIKDSDPNQVNHDLERLFRQSSVVALEYIKTLFLRDLGQIPAFDGLSKKDLENLTSDLKDFFKENIANLSELMKTELRQPLDKSQIHDPQNFLDKIIDDIFRQTTVRLSYGNKQILKAFYADKLPYCFDLAFKEALKHDEVGFKAFQIWTLEEMRQQTNRTFAEQQKLTALITSLKEGGNFLDFEKEKEKWEEFSEKIYETLEKEMSGIRQELIDLSGLITVRFDELFSLSSKIYDVTLDTNNDVKEVLDLIKNKQSNSTNAIEPIKRELGVTPFVPQYFIGRASELTRIREQFLEGNTLIPLSGDGGLGKSSLASTYYHTYFEEYEHLIWVFNGESMLNSLLSLAGSLQLTLTETMPIEKRIEDLLKALRALPKPCLLVIDNANDEEDVNKNHQLIRRLHNFHILVTTRLKTFGTTEVYKIGSLSKVTGLQLFSKYYKRHTSDEDELFFQLQVRVGGNTLVIELLAKYLNRLNRFKIAYTLPMLLAEIRKGILGLSTSTEVGDIDYHASHGDMRYGTPTQIIMAMYEISELDENQVGVLTAFSVLPSESIDYETLAYLFNHHTGLDETLDYLHQTGWLDLDDTNATFKMSPVIQDIIRKKSGKLSQMAFSFIDKFLKKEQHFSKETMRLYFRYGVHIADTFINELHNDLSLIAEEDKILAGLLTYMIADQFDNQYSLLDVDRFVDLSIKYYEHVFTTSYLADLLDLHQKGTLSDEQKKPVIDYVNSLTLGARTKESLGFLRQAGILFEKARELAEDREDSSGKKTGFNIGFDIYIYQRYLRKAGRLIEAESYFFNTYKTHKKKYRQLGDLHSDEDLIQFYEFSAEQLLTIDMEKVRSYRDYKKDESFYWMVAASLDLAKVFRIQGRLEEAVYFHNKFIELSAGNPNDPLTEIAVGKHSLAITLLLNANNLDYAEQLLNEALEVYKRYYPLDTLFIGQYYMHMLDLQLKRGIPLDQCFHYYEKARTIISQNTGDESIDIAEMQMNIYDAISKDPGSSGAWSGSGIGDSIIHKFFDKLDATIDQFGIYHPQLHRGLELTAKLLNEQNRSDHADEVLRKRMEFIRILNQRTEIRTYNFPRRAVDHVVEKKGLVAKLKPITSLPIAIDEFQISVFELPFYKDYDLCQVTFVNGSLEYHKYFLISDIDVKPIETSNEPLYQLGKTNLILTDEWAKKYVSFFFDAVIGTFGKFYILNDSYDIPWRVDIPIKDSLQEGIESLVSPIEVIQSNENEHILSGHILFKDAIFLSKFNVNRSTGQIDLFDERLVSIDTSEEKYKRILDDLTEEEQGNTDIIQSIPACIDPLY